MRPTQGLLQPYWCIGWTGEDLRCDNDLPWGQKKLASISPFQDYPIIPRTFIKRPAGDACLHMGGILAEGSTGSAVSAGSASLLTYSVFTSGWNFFKLGTYI